MMAPNPIPSGSKLEADRQASKPGTIPKLPPTWTASVLLSPFGDSISPLPDPAELIIGTIETSTGTSERWMRVGLFLTQSRRYSEFFFLNRFEEGQPPQSDWYWVDSSLEGAINQVYGPFKTTLQIPGSDFFEEVEAQWGNTYPLMCSDQNPKGVPCDHWVLPTPGSWNHGTWCAFRKDTGLPFRLFAMDSNNPLMLPILGSFYIANLPTFAPGVSKAANAIAEMVRKGAVIKRSDYWNPMITQEDVHRALALPLAATPCTPEHIATVIPGFTTRSGSDLPQWTHRTYIEGWTLGTDLIPYATRIFYLWTGDANSKQQTVFIGLGTSPGAGTYLLRTDTCLNTAGTVQPYYEWDGQAGSWAHKKCLAPIPGVGLPYPDWVARDHGRIMGQIRGNPNFGLGSDQALNCVAAMLPRGGGELAIFWLWFLENGTGMLFTEGNYMNPLSHNLQLIDYCAFIRDADVGQGDFSNPCLDPNDAKKTVLAEEAAHGHLTALV